MKFFAGCGVIVLVVVTGLAGFALYIMSTGALELTEDERAICDEAVSTVAGREAGMFRGGHRINIVNGERKVLIEYRPDGRTLLTCAVLNGELEGVARTEMLPEADGASDARDGTAI